MYPAPQDLDRDALQILREAGFVWDSRLSGFRKRARGSGQAASLDGAVIDYAFLRAQQLIQDSALDPLGRRGQLQRLRILVRSLD